jgi:protease IV
MKRWFGAGSGEFIGGARRATEQGVAVRCTPRRRVQRRVWLGAALIATSFSASVAFAQSSPRPERLPDPGRSTASSDDSTAINNNPANLAFLPGGEFRWSSVYLDEDLSSPLQGHAFSAAARLPFSLATGIRLDLLAPPDGSSPLFGADYPNYQWLTWALALRSGPRSAMGFSLQRSFSADGRADDLFGLSLGYSTRPVNGLGISLVAHDLNSPHNLFQTFNRSFTGAVALRPFGTRTVELDVESRYVTVDETWTPKVGLGLDVPYVGRLRAEGSIDNPTRETDRAWLASLGLSIYANAMDNSLELSGGALTGDALGPQGTLGESNGLNAYAGIAMRSFREPVGFEGQRYGVRIRLEDTPDSRLHVGFLRQLWSLAKEPKVDAVVFELRSSPADSLAEIQELRDAVFELRRAGKRTLCHLEDATGAAMYFCAAANKTYIAPAGGLRFAGMRSQHMYFARLLDKLGVKADFIRIGPHKSAPEQFTRSSATDVARADKIDLLQQYERHFTEGVAVGRNLTAAQVRERVANGPFVSREALEQGFVDGLAFDDEVDAKVRELTGRSTPVRWDERKPRAGETFGAGGAIAVVHVTGDLIDGRSRSVPFLGMQVAGSYTIADTLKAVRENPEVKAVVVRVDSPGGSSVASDVMWRQVKLTAQKKPTVVSMGTVAASGGYLLSMGATRVFANPLTITGSIGVFYGKVDVSELLNRIGVDIETYRTTDRADAESLFRPFSAEERKVLEQKVEIWYQDFLTRVAEGRRMTKEEVDKVAQGHVWTGEQALKHGLVDELGGLRQALAYARQKANLPEDAPVIELPVIETSLFARLLGIPGLQQSLLDAPMPKGLTQTLRALGPFLVHDQEKPMARMEFALYPQ